MISACRHFLSMLKKRLYFDYASTTPLLNQAKEAMLPFLDSEFGNAGSLHSFGQEAIRALDKSRETIARLLGADFRQIIFTSSATEANNLALRGCLPKFKSLNNESKKVPHIISTFIEHESVLRALSDMEIKGEARITILPVNKKGMIDPWSVKDAITEDTVLVSIMYANNEMGSIEPISKIGSIIKSFRGKNSYPLFHVDAVQAFQFLDCNVHELNVDLMTISSHKVYGPKGAAALFVREPNTLSPLFAGGGQEFGLRSGTENIPAIVGFAKAAEVVVSKREENKKKLRDLSLFLWQVLSDVAEIDINGPLLKDERLPNILNIHFLGKENEELLAKLDLAGIAVSAGSACKSRSLETSHVLGAIGLPEKRIEESIRISLGAPTTKEEIVLLGEVIKSL